METVAGRWGVTDHLSIVRCHDSRVLAKRIKGTPEGYQVEAYDEAKTYAWHQMPVESLEDVRTRASSEASLGRTSGTGSSSAGGSIRTSTAFAVTGTTTTRVVSGWPSTSTAFVRTPSAAPSRPSRT
jgi:hypothetical protein